MQGRLLHNWQSLRRGDGETARGREVPRQGKQKDEGWTELGPPGMLILVSVKEREDPDL